MPQTRLEEDIGRRMSESPTFNWYLVAYRDKADEDLTIAYAIYYLVKRAIDRHKLHNFLKFDVRDCKLIDDLKQYVGKQAERAGYKDYRDKILLYYLDKILKKNGCPTITETAFLAYKLYLEKRDDFTISVDEFAKKLGIEPEKLIPTLALSGWFAMGIHISTMRHPKYRLPPRQLGFDSLFIRGKRLKNFLESYRDIYEIEKKTIINKNMKLKPSTLTKTGRKGYIVEYDGEIVFITTSKKELMSWLKKHGEQGMKVYKINNCWKVLFSR